MDLNWPQTFPNRLNLKSQGNRERACGSCSLKRIEKWPMGPRCFSEFLSPRPSFFKTTRFRNRPHNRPLFWPPLSPEEVLVQLDVNVVTITSIKVTIPLWMACMTIGAIKEPRHSRTTAKIKPRVPRTGTTKMP